MKTALFRRIWVWMGMLGSPWLCAVAQDAGTPWLRPAAAEVHVGEVFSVSAEQAGADVEVLWAESGGPVRVVQRQGRRASYRARAEGEAIICASIGGTICEARVRIVAAPAPGTWIPAAGSAQAVFGQGKNEPAVQAQILVNQGYALEQAGRIPEALASYAAAQKLAGDPRLQAKIQALRAGGSGGSSPGSGDAPGSSALAPLPDGDPAAFSHLVDLSFFGGSRSRPVEMRGVLVDASSYLRLKSTDEKRLRLDIPVPKVPASSIALVACLDDAASVPTGTALARMTVTTTEGERTFDLQAGIHASDRAGGEREVRHAVAEAAQVKPGSFFSRFSLPDGAKVSRIRFDYIDPQAEADPGATHAPGFVIRGITLIKSKNSSL